MKQRAKVGFLPRNPRLYRLYNIGLAILLIVIAFPLMLIIAFILLVTQGSDILYSGPRVGKDGRVFRIFKFRTLCRVRAAELTRTCALPRENGIETPFGKILRETRLDELPQLLNVVRGDMNICGPRPVRPEIALIERANIKNYDQRFIVRPGLIGPTQALFGHGTSKTIRARMNHILVKRHVSMLAEMSLFCSIGVSVVSKIGREVVRSMPFFVLERENALDLRIYLVIDGDEKKHLVKAISSNFLNLSQPRFFSEENSAIVYIHIGHGQVRKAKIKLMPCSSAGNIQYVESSDFSRYIIDRYALGVVILQPKRGPKAVEDHPFRGFRPYGWTRSRGAFDESQATPSLTS